MYVYNMNIDKLSIILTRDFKKEYIEFENNYLKYAPLNKDAEEGHGIYREIDMIKRDNQCYIKHKYKNLWLYDIEGKAVFLPLHKRKGDFTNRQPTVCWIEYTYTPMFIIYKPTKYGGNNVFLLNYLEKDGKIIVSWKDHISKATMFRYNVIQWKEYLYDENKTFNDLTKKSFTQYK
jgi:hypothetical protein